MAGEFTRWSQEVRRPGAVEVLAHHDSSIPRMGDEAGSADVLPCKRLYVRDLDATRGLSVIDVTSTAALAMLEGFLHSGAHVSKSIGWRSRGYGRLRRDTFHIRPLGSVNS